MSSDQSPQAPEQRSREKAVALQYRDRDQLPKIVATGAGEIAREILRIAKEHDVPIEHDETLAGMLSQLGTGSTISPESFRLVAEIMCFLYQADLEFQRTHPHVGELSAEPSSVDAE